MNKNNLTLFLLLFAPSHLDPSGRVKRENKKIVGRKDHSARERFRLPFIYPGGSCAKKIKIIRKKQEDKKREAKTWRKRINFH